MTRLVLIKLHDHLATPEGRLEVAESARTTLISVPGVTGVRAGPPADKASEASWDVALEITLEGPQVYEAYARDAGHLAWLADFLTPRAACKKAWNFSL